MRASRAPCLTRQQTMKTTSVNTRRLCFIAGIRIKNLVQHPNSENYRDSWLLLWAFTKIPEYQKKSCISRNVVILCHYILDCPVCGNLNILNHKQSSVFLSMTTLNTQYIYADIHHTHACMRTQHGHILSFSRETFEILEKSLWGKQAKAPEKKWDKRLTGGQMKRFGSRCGWRRQRNQDGGWECARLSGVKAAQQRRRKRMATETKK